MAVLKGIDGNVKVGANAVAKIGEWTVSREMKDNDTTSFGDTWETSETGIKSWNGTFKGFLVPDDTNGHVALDTAWNNGTDVALALVMSGTKTISGNVKLLTIGNSDKVDELVTIDYSFKGNGACTVSFT